jgi:hypothetical protein
MNRFLTWNMEQLKNEYKKLFPRGDGTKKVKDEYQDDRTQRVPNNELHRFNEVSFETFLQLPYEAISCVSTLFDSIRDTDDFLGLHIAGKKLLSNKKSLIAGTWSMNQLKNEYQKFFPQRENTKPLKTEYEDERTQRYAESVFSDFNNCPFESFLDLPTPTINEAAVLFKNPEDQAILVNIFAAGRKLQQESLATGTSYY